MSKTKCPNCESYTLTSYKKMFITCIGIAILSIPWVLIYVGVLFLIPAIIVAIFSLFKWGKHRCSYCKWEGEL